MGGTYGLLRALHTDANTGIILPEGMDPSQMNDEIERRRQVYGANRFRKAQMKTLWQLICANFDDYINQILLVAAVVSTVIGYFREGFPSGLIDGMSIMFALVIIIVVGSSNAWDSERKLAELLAKSEEQMVAVHRDSSTAAMINSEDLVVGDVYRISSGMRIPADSILILGCSVSIDESELTGESVEQQRKQITDENH